MEEQVRERKRENGRADLLMMAIMMRAVRHGGSLHAVMQCCCFVGTGFTLRRILDFLLKCYLVYIFITFSHSKLELLIRLLGNHFESEIVI